MVRDQLTLAASVGRVGATMIREKFGREGGAVGPDDVPAGVDQLSKDWLTAVLCRRVPDARVVGFTAGSGSEGGTSRRALTVCYNDAGQAAGLPRAVFSKALPRFLSRLIVGITGIGSGEALFYDRIRPELDIGAPAGYYGGWDPRSWRYMVLIEDIAATRQASFPEAGIKVDRAGAECMIREMAGYHGAMWEDPRLDTEWSTLVDPHAWQRSFNTHAGGTLGVIAAYRLGAGDIPSELLARRSEIRGSLMRSLEINRAGTRTLLHQDPHPRNWFQLPDGSVHLFDWQCIAKGNWALDVSYALCSVLDTEDRRAWERDLLELYLDELGTAGGKPPPLEEAWLAYRQQVIHSFAFWAYTLSVNHLSDIHPQDVTRGIVRRTGQAMVDLDTLDAIRA